MAKSGRNEVRPSFSLVSFQDYAYHKNLVIGSIALSLFVCVLVLLVQAVKEAPELDYTVNSEGLTELQLSQLSESIKAKQKGNYFSVDLRDIRDTARKISWVKEVSVTKNWYEGITVRALPRKPIARFGSERLVDANGDVFKPAKSGGRIEYPLVNLQGEPEKVSVIMTQMQQINSWYAPLGIAVEDIVLTPRMTWLVRFDSGLRILVDGENTAQKLMSVSQVLQNQLQDKKDDIQSIDMRYKNGFAISWKNGKSPLSFDTSR